MFDISEHLSKDELDDLVEETGYDLSEFSFEIDSWDEENGRGTMIIAIHNETGEEYPYGAGLWEQA